MNSHVNWHRNVFRKKVKVFPLFSAQEMGRSSKGKKIQAPWGTVSTDSSSCHLCPARTVIQVLTFNPNNNKKDWLRLDENIQIFFFFFFFKKRICNLKKQILDLVPNVTY